jgi:predicted Zn-dependent protease
MVSKEKPAVSDEMLSAGYGSAAELLRARKPAQALQILGLLMVAAPARHAYFRLAGVALHQMGELELAAGYYETALALRPGDARSTIHLGEIHIERGSSERGRALLESGLASVEGRPELHSLAERARTALQFIETQETGHDDHP